MSRSLVDYYALLGVACPDGGGATGVDEAKASDFSAELRRAYHAKIKVAHPDHAGGDRETSLTAANINEAYAVLSDPERRAEYNRAYAEQEKLAENLVQTTHFAQSFTNHFDWIVAICKLVKAVRDVKRSMFSFKASDKALAGIQDAAERRHEAVLKERMAAFVASETHWDTMSARTLFFNLFIMNRTAIGADERQVEATRCVSVYAVRCFDMPVVAKEEKPEETDRYEAHITEQARQIPSLDIRLGFLRYYLGGDVERCALYCELLAHKQAMKTEIEFTSAMNRRYQLRLSDIPNDKKEEAQELIDALIVMHTKQHQTQADFTPAITELEKQLAALEVSAAATSAAAMGR